MSARGHSDEEDEMNQPEEEISRTGFPFPFPQELIDQFINNLGDYCDRMTLKTCALVCRAWLHQSRRRLFRQMSISPPERGGEQAIPNRLAQLIEHLHHPLCTFATSVRALFISSGVEPAEPDWVIPLIAQLDKMVSIDTFRVFTFESVPGTFFCKSMISKEPSFFSKITCLTLIVYDLGSMAGAIKWMEIIHMLQSLVELELGGIFAGLNGVQTIGNLSSIEVLPPVTLQTVRLSLPDYHSLQPFFQVMVQWLHQNQTVLSTIEFSSMEIGPADENFNISILKSLFGYLQFLGPSLESLKFGLPCMKDGSGPFDMLDGILGPKLQKLELECVFNSVSSPIKPIIEESFQLLFFFNLLSRALKPLSNLTTMKFTFKINPPISSDKTLQLKCYLVNNDTICAALDKLLVGPNFPVLSVVAIQVGTQADSTQFDWRKYMESKFPLCRQRRLLLTETYTVSSDD